MRAGFIIILICAVIAGCNKKKHFDGPNSYADGFENYSTIDDLVDGNDDRWSFFQQSRDENSLTIDTTIYHTGGKSFKSSAIASSDADGASKASINKQNMAFWEGETVVADMWYYIEGTENAKWLFLFDLEEQTAIGAGPGMRLAMVNNQLRVEHKYPNPDIVQAEGNEIDVPRNQWVNIRFETKLSKKKRGYVKVWQDGILILEQDKWKTLPKDILYVNQGTKGMYSQIEFGVTANSKDNPMTVYVDDIDVWTIE